MTAWSRRWPQPAARAGHGSTVSAWQGRPFVKPAEQFAGVCDGREAPALCTSEHRRTGVRIPTGRQSTSCSQVCEGGEGLHRLQLTVDPHESDTPIAAKIDRMLGSSPPADLAQGQSQRTPKSRTLAEDELFTRREPILTTCFVAGCLPFFTSTLCSDRLCRPGRSAAS